MLLTYEIVVTVAFLAVLIWTLNTRSPIALGAIVGGFLLSGFDWLWCSRGFWNATTAGGLVMVPGLHIMGVHYPITICFVWSIGFGFIPVFASSHYPAIARAFGRLHIPIIFVIAAIIDWLIEYIGVTTLGVWTYHQAPAYLLGGVPWSNSWFLGGVLACSYFGLAKVKKWGSISDNAGFSPFSENTWKGVLLAASAIFTPAFLLGVAQLFWWSATQPWVESGRPY